MKFGNQKGGGDSIPGIFEGLIGNTGNRTQIGNLMNGYYTQMELN